MIWCFRSSFFFEMAFGLARIGCSGYVLYCTVAFVRRVKLSNVVNNQLSCPELAVALVSLSHVHGPRGPSKLLSLLLYTALSCQPEIEYCTHMFRQ